MLSAHGIAAVVGGEQHANMLGGLGGSFISLDIWVAGEDAEEAAALLRDLRGGDHGDDERGDDEPAPESDDEDDDEPGDPIDLRIDRRRRTGVALMLACFVTFGTAHMFARAWRRGLTLATIEIIGISQMIHAPLRGALLIGGSILADAVGSVWWIRKTSARATLPTARLHS